VLLCPRLLDFDLIDRLLEATSSDDWNSEPLEAVGGLDAIAVVPMPLHILCAIEDHIFVAMSDEVKKAFPWNVTRLNDADSHVFVVPLIDLVEEVSQTI